MRNAKTSREGRSGGGREEVKSKNHERDERGVKFGRKRAPSRVTEFMNEPLRITSHFCDLSLSPPPPPSIVAPGFKFPVLVAEAISCGQKAFGSSFL